MALPNTRSAQAVKPRTEINEMQSLQLTRNLIRIAISEISYIRGLFPEKYFLDRYLPALEMKVKKLMPVDEESRRLIDWMEKGVYDALQKKYLETLLFRLCDGEYGPMIEEYAFCFRYDISSERVSMDVTRSNGHGGKGKLMNTNSDITPAQMKAAACKMIRTLVQLMRTLNNVPEQRTIIMQLYYHADTTPADYEPPFFRSCTYEDTKLWAKKPLKMKVGNVNSKHFEVSLKVRSILDPCEDEVDVCVKSEDKMDYSSSTGADAPGTSHDFASHVETPGPSSKYNSPHSEKKLVTSTIVIQDVQRICEGKLAEIDDDMTQESQSDFISAIKEWAVGLQSDTFDEILIFASFPHIPMTLLQELVDRLVEDRFMEKHGTDKYRVSSFKEHELSCKDVGLNEDSFTTKSHLSASPNTDLCATSTHIQGKVTVDEEKLRLYEKALALVLLSRMKHVTVRDLTCKLGEKVSTSVVNHLLQRMGKEGYIEITPSSRRLGRRVLRPLQAPVDDLLEIVEGVKDVVIAEADDGSQERSISDDAKGELRTKSRAEFMDSLNSKKSSELRSKNRCDSLFNSLNPDPYEPRSKADSTAMRTLDIASREQISNNPISSLRNTRRLPTESADAHRPTKITDSEECRDRKPFSPDNSTTERSQCRPADTSCDTISREEAVGLPMSSYDARMSQNTVTVTDCEKNLLKSHNRIRKASKVEEPIYQSMNSTKRMRA